VFSFINKNRGVQSHVFKTEDVIQILFYIALYFVCSNQHTKKTFNSHMSLKSNLSHGGKGLVD